MPSTPKARNKLRKALTHDLIDVLVLTRTNGRKRYGCSERSRPPREGLTLASGPSRVANHDSRHSPPGAAPHLCGCPQKGEPMRRGLLLLSTVVICLAALAPEASAK